MRVLVTGGRDYADYNTVVWALDELNPSTIIHGGARGADSLADKFARARGIPVDVFEADWTDLSHPDAHVRNSKGGKYDAMAGPRRNKRMLAEGSPDVIVAFPGGKGTASMVKLAKEANIHVISITLSVDNAEIT